MLWVENIYTFECKFFKSYKNEIYYCKFSFRLDKLKCIQFDVQGYIFYICSVNYLWSIYFISTLLTVWFYWWRASVIDYSWQEINDFQRLIRLDFTRSIVDYGKGFCWWLQYRDQESKQFWVIKWNGVN